MTTTIMHLSMVSPIPPTWEDGRGFVHISVVHFGHYSSSCCLYVPSYIVLYGTVKITDCIYLLLQMKQQRQSGHRVVGEENMEESYAPYLGNSTNLV